MPKAMFELHLRHPRIFLVLSCIQFYLGHILLLCIAFVIGYSCHDQRITAVPWYKWVLRGVEVTDIFLMFVAGRYGRSAAIVFRVGNGHNLHHAYLITSLTASALSICISVSVLIGRSVMGAEWTLIPHGSPRLYQASVWMFFTFVTLKMGVQILSLALAVCRGDGKGKFLTVPDRVNSHSHTDLTPIKATV